MTSNLWDRTRGYDLLLLIRHCIICVGKDGDQSLPTYFYSDEMKATNHIRVLSTLKVIKRY